MWLWTKITPRSKAEKWLQRLSELSSCLCVKMTSVCACVEHPSVNVPGCAVTSGVCVWVCLCTCIRALSTSQHRWRGGYIGSFCRSQTSTQGRGLVCWPGKPHHVAGCPVACSDHWGVHLSCSLRAEEWKRVQWIKKYTVTYTFTYTDIKWSFTSCTSTTCSW